MKRQKSSQQDQVVNPNCRIKELEDRLSSALEQLQISRKERAELQIELVTTRKVTQVLLRKQAEEISTTIMQQFYPYQLSDSEIHATSNLIQICLKKEDNLQAENVNTHMITKELRQPPLIEFSVSEIHEATKYFDPPCKIAEGTRGNVYYKCVLRQTQVAVKVLGQNSLQDPSRFQQEVDDLSNLRHPNLVTLIGVCPEIWALIYEYLPNGSLEDHLNCKDDTPPLPWQTRIHKLLSGRSAQGIAEGAQNALLNEGNLNSFLDSSAGKWPHQVAQLTHLAIRCCEINPSRRPDLASEVLKVLETIAGSDDYSPQPPSYFICPILQGVITDPHVAADGYTYEAKALQEWLADHETSPMTNLRLPQRNVIPNHPLRSAIRQWQQNHRKHTFR